MKQYKVGDKVTIRSWESMEREFGLNESGNICSPRFDFVKPMADFCGLEAFIEEDIGECYHIENGRCYAFTPQMFTDWETDNAKETKMQYNGQEVELITEGYWPEGVTLICGDDVEDWAAVYNVVCLRKNHALANDGRASAHWKYWALLPTKPAPRRLTNREVSTLCKKGWDLLDGEWVYLHWNYKKEYENDPTPQGVTLRAQNSDEWLEPTSDLLERAV